MDLKDLDDYMRRVLNQLAAFEERIDRLEKIESLAVPVYDDLQVSISNLRIPASSAPTWRTWNYGIGGGVTFSILGFDPGEYVDVYIQSSHSMKLSSLLDYHIHWSIPSNSTGDRIQFQIDAIAAPVGEAFAAITGSPFTVEIVLDGTESGAHNLLDLAEIEGINETISTAYILKFQRIAASSNEYAGELYLMFSDGHYLKDSIGSREELSK